MFEFLSITLIIVLAVMSPGPDFAITTRNALRYSQKTGITTAFGIACGSLIHASYCIVGFGLIISQSLLLFTGIKFIGASYLIYLGIKGLREKQVAQQISVEKSNDDISFFSAFRQGFLCNVFNPKTMLFFLALFTMMIKPSMPLIIQVSYAIEIALAHFLWFAFVATLFSHKKVKIFLGSFMHYITKAFGGMLVMFGLKIASTI